MSISFCQLDAHGTPCNLGQRLRADGQPVVLVDVHNAATLPADLDEVQGVIVCGGGASVTAHSGAIEALVQRAARAEIPLLAIGAGARLVARALGGEVTPCSERGLATVKLNALGREEPLFAGQPWAVQQAVWNDECVSRPPEGARVLASTPSARYAAWGIGPWILAVDWHFEWNAREITECAQAQGAVSSVAIERIERLGALFSERVGMMLMPRRASVR
jgi:GMP synthase (glutamine-hydrolysing)